MSNNDIMKDLLKDCSCAGPASEVSIRSAEEQLGVHLPPSYRKFLATFGAALCPGFEIAGLYPRTEGDEPPLWLHVVTATLQLRRGDGMLPTGYVAISGDGGDFTYFLDTANADSRGECPVVALGPGVDGKVIAGDFPEFVSRAFESRITF